MVLIYGDSVVHRDPYAFEKEQETNTFMDKEIFGYDLWLLLVICTIIFIVFLILSMCWNYCASDDKETEAESKSYISVREVHPGLLVIQGNSPDETARVIKEYETIRLQMAGNSSHSYGGFDLAEAAPPYLAGSASPTSYQVASVLTRTQPTSGSVMSGPLVDLENDPRPPPYAPVP